MKDAHMQTFTVLFGLLVALTAQGLTLPEASASEREEKPTDAEEIDVDSPRQSVMSFIDAAARRDFERASAYLELQDTQAGQGPELAARLFNVVTRRLGTPTESVSSGAAGDRNDGLPRNVDQIGTIALTGREQPVRLVARDDRSPRWKFSSRTVARIDGWYEELPDYWL
ncbi:MAG: hypothetical protein H7Z43_09420, partial [Clostridia bacterium]|nr:hypothetical protein [Deltaproteobacteria bacterium]